MSGDDQTKTIAFVLYPGFTILDMVGPLQVLSSLRQFSSAVRTVVVAERVEPMPTDTPLQLVASATFEEVPNPFAVLVPGGGAPTIRAMGDPAIREYVLHANETAQLVASVCTGALIVAAAGLLEGRRATTHWAYHSLLEKLGATYVPERWVEDGKYVTSAGVSAGIDLGLHLAERFTDRATARLVQLSIEYDPQSPFGGIEWSTVDRDIFAPMLDVFVRQELAEHPKLQARLLAAASSVTGPSDSGAGQER